MAEYLIQDTTLTAIGNAIRAKTETTDLIPVPDIPEKIAAIETGITVQKQTNGSFTTNTSGSATATCGFRPDFVTVYTATYNGTEEGFSFPFSEQQNQSVPYAALGWHSDGVYEATASRSATGFTISVKNLGWDVGDSGSAVSKKKFNYIAVKYT